MEVSNLQGIPKLTFIQSCYFQKKLTNILDSDVILILKSDQRCS